MLRIKKHDLEIILEYWRARCETMVGDDNDVVSIYIGSPDDMEGRKECHVAFSDDGDVYIVDDNCIADTSNLIVKDGYLHHDMNATVAGTPEFRFNDHTAFYEGDEVVSAPHREHIMSRFTKGK